MKIPAVKATSSTRRSTILALTILLSPAWAFAAPSPDLGDDKVSAISGTRKVAIAEFGVEFYTQMAGGSNQSGSTARLTSTLRGVEDKDFQAIADQAYADTVNALKAAGFEVLDPALIKANPGYQSLVEKYGQDAPYTLSDSTFVKGITMVSKIFTSESLKAYFSTSNKNNRGSLGQRIDAQNQGRGAKEGDIAKSLGATLLHVHYLVGFTTIKDHGHKVIFSSGSATVKSDVGTNLVAEDTEWQFVNEGGARTFTTSSRARHSGAVYLDDQLTAEENIYTTQDTTTAESKRSDAIGNAVGVALGFLAGSSSSATSKNKTSDVTASSADAYRKQTNDLIGVTATAFADKLGAAK
jgi:hypothetical protein